MNVCCVIALQAQHTSLRLESEQQWGRSDPGRTGVQEWKSWKLPGASALLSFMENKNDLIDKGSFFI